MYLCINSVSNFWLILCTVTTLLLNMNGKSLTVKIKKYCLQHIHKYILTFYTKEKYDLTQCIKLGIGICMN